MQSLSSMLPWMTGITVAASAAFYAQQHFKWMGGTLPSRDMPSFKPEHKEAEMKNRFNCVSAGLTSLPPCCICTLQECMHSNG